MTTLALFVIIWIAITLAIALAYDRQTKKQQAERRRILRNIYNYTRF